MYCSSCGTANDANNFRCVQCGTIIQSQAPQGYNQPNQPYGGGYAQQWAEPSKADTALIFAVLGWVVCALLSIAAIPMARGEIAAIERGDRNPAKLSTAKAAFWLAAIQLGLFAFGMVIAILVVVLGAVAR